jgi:hypothetical protein
MIASSGDAKPVVLALPALLLLLLLPLAAACGQGAPIPLVPGAGSPPPPAAQQPAEQPAAPPPAAAERPFPEATNPRAEPVQVRELGAIGSDATGVLDDRHGGFSPAMWAGTDIALVRKVLPLLPDAPAWRSARQLERRLLLTAAATPAGPPAGEPLIKLRAAKLLAMGEVDGLDALLKGAASQSFTPDLRRLLVDAALLAGDTSTACEQVPVLRQMAPDDPFPGKLQVYCQFASGNTRQAALGVDLLREQKVSDPGFFLAADALNGVPPGKVDGFGEASPLNLAMARAAKIALPESVVAGNASPAVLRAMAQSSGGTPEIRLTAGERAEAAGVLDIDALRRMYQSVEFPQAQLAAPLTAGTAEKGARGRALLYRAAVQQSSPSAKAEIIGKALAQAGDGEGYFTAARLYSAEIAAITPTPDLAWFAYPAARALFAAGQADAAKPWAALARSQQPIGDAAAQSGAALAVLARLAGIGDSLPAGVLASWRAARADLPGEAAGRRAAVVYCLLAALGDTVPGEQWLSLYDGPPLVASLVPRPALWQGLRLAAEGARQGETVMLALASLGDTPPGRADPTTLHHVVAALHRIGLDADARALAVETAIANGG